MQNIPETTSRLRVFVTLLITGCLVTPAIAESNSKGPNSPIVVGTLKSVDASGTKLEVLQRGDYTRILHTHEKTKTYYIGLPNKADHKPTVGFGVKASSEKDGRLKSISFTPEIGAPKPLGEEKLSMTAAELFATIDRDDNKSVGYVEFSEKIYSSPKHGPDSFRKADKNADGELNQNEFEVALSDISWWKLSRQAPDEWFARADKNNDDELDTREFAVICTSGNHIDNIFKRTDSDSSGQLSIKETTAYIRSVTHGAHQEKETKKSRRK